MDPSEENRRKIQGLLEGLSVEEVRACAVEALRLWWRGKHRSSDSFQLHGDFGVHMAPILAKRKQMTIDPHFAKEPFLMDQREPWMREVVEFFWWMVRSGLAIPLMNHQGGYPSQMRMTSAGARLLESTDEHPLLPGFLERMRVRSPGLPDEVIVHLVDAQACLEHALARPAIVLIGLAYETAIVGVVTALGGRGVVAAEVAEQGAAKKIAAVRAALPKLSLEKEAYFSALAAWDFADLLRRRRNDGSHSKPVYDFSDLGEIHEFFLSATRHLPVLWTTAQ
jgi:hypothetical protein